MRAFGRGNGGFTLIEILVAMLLLAIGFLGLAAVQSKSLSETQSTQFRTKADVLLRDMADRMRANKEAVVEGSYLIDDDAVVADVPAACPANPDAFTCMAQRDLVLWKNAVDDALPEPHVSIADLGAGQQLLRIDWREKTTESSDRTVNPCSEDQARSCVEMRVLIVGEAG